MYLSSKIAQSGNATVILGPVITDRYDQVTGTVFADQAGTIFIEQSFDWNPVTQAGNFDLSTSYAITANTGKGFTEDILAPWLRIRYTNGSTPQTVFRLYARHSAAGEGT